MLSINNLKELLRDATQKSSKQAAAIVYVDDKSSAIINTHYLWISKTRLTL